MHRSSLAGASGPARLQTGATFNDLLVNCPPDTCKNKAGVRGAGAVSRVPARAPCPGGARPGVPPHPAGSGRAGAAGGGPGRAGMLGQDKDEDKAFPMWPIPRAQRALSSRTYRDIFQRIRGDHALFFCFFFFFSLRRPIRLSVPVPPPPPLLPPAFAIRPPDPVPPFPLR